MSLGDKNLNSRPFADVGAIRYIRFSALGTEWTLSTANDIDSVREAERFASATQVMLAALAREDMCLIQTQINVRIENTPGTTAPVWERIKFLSSNDRREWVIQLAPIRPSDHIHPGEHTAELLAMLTVILREASLLPEAEFSATLERAFESGLGHKLSPGRPYDQLVARFAADTEVENQICQYSTPWNCRDGLLEPQEELHWQDGPGPTYSRENADLLLKTRYANLAENVRITVAMLTSSEEFRSIVKALRTKGWLDWHILVAIANIVMNYRFSHDRYDLRSEAARRKMAQAATQPESASAEPVPIGFFTHDAMNRNRTFAMMSLLKHWGLECQQRTPDMTAIERLLAARYGYWDDDVPHEDPFPDNSRKESNE